MSFPLPETRLPGLAPLLAGGLWQKWSERGQVFPVAEARRAIQYVRLKPDTSCRLTIFESVDDASASAPIGFLLYLFPDRERAKDCYEKERSRRHVAEGRWSTFIDETHCAVGIPFPNDPELPELRRLYEPDRFRRALAEVLPQFPESDWRIQRQLIQTRLLAFKPGRRAVFRVKVKLRHRTADEKRRIYLHAKVCTESFAQRSFTNLSAVHAAVAEDTRCRVAAPCGRSAERPFVAAHWVEGESIAERLARPEVDPRPELRQAGAALATLHTLDLELDHVASPLEEGDRLLELAEDLGALLPDVRDDARQLADSLACALSRLALGPSSIIHGDFHPGQVIVTAGGVVLVDFDQAGRGYAAADVGEFRARLEEVAAHADWLAAFVAGYESVHQAERLAPDEVAVTTAAALFRRATVPFRELRCDWPAAIRTRLARCRALLSEVGA